MRGNHIADGILKSAASEVQIVKPAWFMEMWEGAVKTMQSENPHFESTFSPPDYKIPMVNIWPLFHFSLRKSAC